MARDFRERLGLRSDIWVDKERTTFRHLGFKRGLFRTLLHPRAFRSAARALRKGLRQGRTRGDPWQQGGVLVVDREGSLRYAYAAEVAGDHPPTGEVVAQALKTG